MALDQLLSALDREASAAVERLLATARAEATAVTAAAEREHAHQRELSLEPRARAARAEMEQALALTSRAALGETLHARERLMQRVFAAVRAALPATLSRGELHRSLSQNLALAIECVAPGNDVIIRCPAGLAPILQPMACRRAGTTVEADPTSGNGFHLATVDGAFGVIDTLESRLERSATEVARDALRRLVPVP